MVDHKNCTPAIGIYKYIGMMFKPNGYNKTLVFEFKKPVRHAIHTWFCNFPIRCIFYDAEDNMIEDIILKPWISKHRPPKAFTKLIEIPINDKEVKQ